MNGNRKLLAAMTVVAAALAHGGLARADDARGESLYTLCVQCHGEAGEGNSQALAPTIAGLDSWYLEAQLKNFRSGARGTHPDDLGGLRMHPMSLWLRQDEDLTAVAEYVSKMEKTAPAPTIEGGVAENGAPLFATCAACHGAQGEGNQALNAPPLAGLSDWYVLTQLQKFKAGVRGGNPQNPNAVMMRGMALSLADEQAIKDVVAHINSLPAK
jgi:cytochrome c oxidase subunit 2